MIRASSSQETYHRASMATIYPRVGTNEPKVASRPSSGHESRHSQGKLDFDSISSSKSKKKFCNFPSGTQTKATENDKASKSTGEVGTPEQTVREMQLQALQQKHTVSKHQSQLRAAQSEIFALKIQLKQQQSSLEQLTNKNLDLTLQHESDRETIAHLEAILMTLQNCGVETTTIEKASPLVPDKSPSWSIACTGENDIWNESLSCFHESTKSCDDWSYSSNNSLNTLELEELQLLRDSRPNTSVQADDSSESITLQQDIQDILQTYDQSSLAVHDVSEDDQCIYSPNMKLLSPTSIMDGVEKEDSCDFVLGLKFLEDSTTSFYAEGANECSREGTRRLPKAA